MDEKQSKLQKPAGMSRRDFLKIMGSASVLGAAGCADGTAQKIFPYVRGDNARITGIPVLFRSTCMECPAGCGIEVKTCDGRVVKIEGSAEHPVNRGGLCAAGQSALQGLYDPDRVREPLARTTDVLGNEVFTPLSWDEAFKRVAEGVRVDGKKKVLLTAGSTGSYAALQKEWCATLGLERVVWDLNSHAALAEASEAVFGISGVPAYSFDEADVIVNFGANFLETWVSPVEFAESWARRRVGPSPCRFIHIEPRLSLTAANSDLWLCPVPGTEPLLAQFVLRKVLGDSVSSGFPKEIRHRLETVLTPLDGESIARKTGIPSERIDLIVHLLVKSRTSLVVAGGTVTRSGNPSALPVLVNYLNLALGNIGKTVHPGLPRTVESSHQSMSDLLDSCAAGDVGLLIVDGSDPVFSFPFHTARDGAPTVRRALEKVDLLVSMSSHFDDTAETSDLVLPSSTFLESWGDTSPRPGVFGIVQPSMLPVHDTRTSGDILLGVARAAGAPAGGSVEDFHGYLRGAWKRLFDLHRPSERNFEEFWSESVKRGGYFFEARAQSIAPRLVDASVLESPVFDSEGIKADDQLVLMPFESVKSLSSSAVNRSWLLELPDPMTGVVWDTWAEMHPATAALKNLQDGDAVVLKNSRGEITLPLVINRRLHEGVVAVPIAHGRKGRYAGQSSGGNVLTILSPLFRPGSAETSLYSTSVAVVRAGLPEAAVRAATSHSQEGREIARVQRLDPVTGQRIRENRTGHEVEHPDNPGQMYDQRKHPVYRWGMAVDLAACTGCSACVVACQAENNVPSVGKMLFAKGREMAWMRIDRYEEGAGDDVTVHFMPMMCQHCNNAPCEPVCPVFATYHNEEGLNAMVYNRCVGTRYCSNNCPYKVRRFNWVQIDLPEPLNWQLNPDVTRRSAGVMEKCTFCVQRIIEARDRAKDLGRLIQDGEVQPACVQGCPSKALVFGDLNDPESAVSRLHRDRRAYKVLDRDVNTQPATAYLEDIKFKF